MHRAARAVASFWRKAYEDGLTGLAAMVAYNLLLSIFPLALIALFVAGRVLRSPELAASVINDARTIFPTAAQSTLVEGVRRLQQSSTTVGIVALVSSLWVGASFWGALDTAFCRIYHLPCRSWVRQKLFGFGMLFVVLIFIAASVAVPTVQSLAVSSAEDLPFGLADARDLVYYGGIALGLLILFIALCITYAAVPKGAIPWSCVWPGALGGDDRDGRGRRDVPALPLEHLDAEDRDERGLRADRARLVLRAGAGRARRRGRSTSCALSGCGSTGGTVDLPAPRVATSRPVAPAASQASRARGDRSDASEGEMFVEAIRPRTTVTRAFGIGPEVLSRSPESRRSSFTTPRPIGALSLIRAQLPSSVKMRTLHLILPAAVFGCLLTAPVAFAAAATVRTHR